MAKLNRALATGLLIAASPAWADDYSKFYQAAPAGSIALLPSTVPAEVAPSSGDFRDDTLRMWERGYALVGYSFFNGQIRDPSKALKFATKLKARYVVATAGQISETSGSVPLALPTSNTAQTFGTVSTGNSYGASATGTFNATTTTNGVQTAYIPFTSRRADQVAAFFQPVERKGSGVYGRDLTAEERAAIGTNHALFVLAVREGSPAFEADVLPGDIILSVNGERLTMDAWNAAMRAPAGTNVKVGLQRRGADKTVAVTIPGNWN
jgi:hypothetical protein